MTLYNVVSSAPCVLCMTNDRELAEAVARGIGGEARVVEEKAGTIAATVSGIALAHSHTQQEEMQQHGRSTAGSQFQPG